MADEQPSSGSNSETIPHWIVWQEAEQPDADGTGRRWRLKCSFCAQELAKAIVVPECGLRICPVCLTKMNQEIQATISQLKTTVNSLSELSGETPKGGGLENVK